jgi:hypothetical protein
MTHGQQNIKFFNYQFDPLRRRAQTGNITVWTYSVPCEAVKFRFSSILLVFTEFQLFASEVTVCFKIKTFFYRTVECSSYLNISAFPQKNRTAIVKGLLYRACREPLQEAVEYTNRVVVFLSTSVLRFKARRRRQTVHTGYR